MKLYYLSEEFSPWEFHTHIVADPNASDVLSMLRLLKKNFPIQRVMAWLADMIPDWNQKVFPKLSPEEIEEINKAVRAIGIPEQFLIMHGFSSKSSKDFKFFHEIYFNQAIDWILEGNWVPSMKQLMMLWINNRDFLRELDQDKFDAFKAYIDDKVAEEKKSPTLKDVLRKTIVDPGDNPDELGIG